MLDTLNKVWLRLRFLTCGRLRVITAVASVANLFYTMNVSVSEMLEATMIISRIVALTYFTLRILFRVSITVYKFETLQVYER